MFNFLKKNPSKDPPVEEVPESEIGNFYTDPEYSVIKFTAAGVPFCMYKSDDHPTTNGYLPQVTNLDPLDIINNRIPNY